MADETMAEKLRREADTTRPKPVERSAEEIEAARQQREARDARYSEGHAPSFIETLTAKAKGANLAGETQASISWEVDRDYQSAVQRTMADVGEYFTGEGFAVAIAEGYTGGTPDGIVKDYEFVPGKPNNKFHSTLTIDWAPPASMQQPEASSANI